MKKGLFIVALVVCLSLSACGQEEDEKVGTVDTESIENSDENGDIEEPDIDDEILSEESDIDDEILSEEPVVVEDVTPPAGKYGEEEISNTDESSQTKNSATGPENSDDVEENIATNPSSDDNKAPIEPRKSSGEETISFKDYLDMNLSGDDYASVRTYSTETGYTIWVVNQAEVERIISEYTGEIPEIEFIVTEYSKNEIDEAIDEIKESEFLKNTQNIRGSEYLKIVEEEEIIIYLGKYDDSVNILISSHYPEFEEFIQDNYGDMAQISIETINYCT